jgi:hypothetical protein
MLTLEKTKGTKKLSKARQQVAVMLEFVAQ